MARSKKDIDKEPYIKPQQPESPKKTLKAKAQKNNDSPSLPKDEPGPLIPSAANEAEKPGEATDTPKKHSEDDDFKTYGEEYYYDGAHHTESYSPPHTKPKAEGANDEKPKTTKKSAAAKASAGNGGGGDDDDDDDEDVPPGNPEKKMPFLDHLEELRWTLMRSIIAVVIGAAVCFIFNEEIIVALRAVAPKNMTLVILGPTEGFMTAIKVALFGGLVLSSPWVAYELWKFIVPGLLDKEKKLVPPIVFFTVICFLLGGAFAYFIMLPFALTFLLGFQTQTENMIAIGKYLSFVSTMILVFGVVFELPVLSYFLSKIGLLTPEFMRSKRRYTIVVIFIVAALLTPPDIYTQTMLAVPLLVLHEISIFVSAAAVRRRREKEAEEGW